jgi:hypothetical protein
MINSEQPINPIILPSGVQSKGLTKREYFAIMALQGILASGPINVYDAAQKAFEVADELLTNFEN